MTETSATRLLDMTAIRLEQAQLLKERARPSCMIVGFIILYISAALLLWGQVFSAMLWFVLSMSMVLVTYLYAKLYVREGLTRETVYRYLRGHIIICCLTGLVWGSFATYLIDWNSYFSLFMASTIVFTITAGGMLPGSAYQPGYIGLATCALLPITLYWLLTAPLAVRLIGLGFLVYYFLGMLASSRAEIGIRETIAARNANNLTAELQRQNEIIQKSIEEKNRFLAATSHDLSQPLHAQGFFIKALRNSLTETGQHALLDKLETSWRMQGQLLEGLVDMTRLDSGAIRPQFSVVNLKADIETLLEEFAPALERAAITVKMDMENIAVFTDPTLFLRIVRNLVSNVVKFTPQGTRLTLTLSEEEGQALFKLEDNGNGISEAEHRRVFEEYVQLANADRDREKGLGLGLSIVKRLASLLGVDMQFTSEIGKGTAFAFTLPLSFEDVESVIATPQADGYFSSLPLVVLVDDEKDIRDSMSALLTTWGCQVISAPSAAEIIRMLDNTLALPKLLIVDKRLEGEDGFAVISALREEVNEETPAILMTGDLYGFEGLENEDIHLMTKPADPDSVRRILSDLVV